MVLFVECVFSEGFYIALAEVVVVHFPLYQREHRVKAFGFFKDILIGESVK